MKAIETPTFHYYNANPKGRKVGDCVVRAISTALGQTWERTMQEMTDLGIKDGRPYNEPKNIEKYLAARGWTKQKEPRTYANKKMPMCDFLNNAGSKGVIIASVGSHHLTLIVNGVNWDIWNCTRQTMHTYYTNPNVVGPELDRPELKPEKRRFTL